MFGRSEIFEDLGDQGLSPPVPSAHRDGGLPAPWPLPSTPPGKEQWSSWGPAPARLPPRFSSAAVAPEQLVAVEYNPDFAEHIRGPVFRASASRSAMLMNLPTRSGLPASTKVAAVVSSLAAVYPTPAPSSPSPRAGPWRFLSLGRPFIQFSYALVPPVPADAGLWTLDVSGWIVRNLPPARVWTYRKA